MDLIIHGSIINILLSYSWESYRLVPKNLLLRQSF